MNRDWVERVLIPATSKSGFGLATVFVVTGYSVVINIFASPQFGYQHLFLRIVAAIVAVAPGLLLVTLAHRIRIAVEARRIATILLAYAIAGAIRGLIVQEVMLRYGLAEFDEWIFRITSSTLLVGAMLMFLSWASHTFRAHRTAVKDLSVETETLQAALESLTQTSAQDSQDQIKAVANRIVEELQRIELTAADSQVAEVENILNDYVRPLTKDRARDVKSWIAPQNTPADSPRRWSAAKLVDHLPDASISLSLALAPLPSAVYWFGWADAITLTIGGALIISLTTTLTYRAVKSPLRKLTSPWIEIGLTCVFVGATIPWNLFCFLLLQNSNSPFAFFPSTVTVFPAISWLITVSWTLWDETVQRRQRLLSVREHLRWAIARINLLTWYNQGVVTRLLHGPIQNSLHATLIRLRDSAPRDVVDASVRELRERISQFTTASSDQPQLHFAESLAELAFVWRGIADVNVQLKPVAEEALTQSPATAEIVLNMCQEACSNSIRHGHATVVDIDVDVTVEGILLRVSDNGDKPDFESPLGVGTKFLNTCSLRWSTSETEAIHTLTIVIPGEKPYWLIDPVGSSESAGGELVENLSGAKL